MNSWAEIRNPLKRIGGGNALECVLDLHSGVAAYFWCKSTSFSIFGGNLPRLGQFLMYDYSGQKRGIKVMAIPNIIKVSNPPTLRKSIKR